MIDIVGPIIDCLLWETRNWRGGFGGRSRGGLGSRSRGGLGSRSRGAGGSRSRGGGVGVGPAVAPPTAALGRGGALAKRVTGTGGWGDARPALATGPAEIRSGPAVAVLATAFTSGAGHRGPAHNVGGGGLDQKRREEKGGEAGRVEEGPAAAGSAGGEGAREHHFPSGWACYLVDPLAPPLYEYSAVIASLP
ncbi:hypothetical protein BJ085DRAFT_30397 [Dimargaris cristalligena]|uniref:Uncharacterized protein n=1 Tax=Dimargaris cristalligena TaxID=215637 RepID=A0A4Q0A2S4_9FUNG|nr:hypothetical protein BJ085DRAFT_30397 [Dimargaris cristalligena]|eukprot:RKP40367.1 hypothetical protein BJ085DRAFT_30397 [Dimargaris cristalligena]